MKCSLPCNCDKCSQGWVILNGKPKAKIIDVLYFDGKEFYNKPLANCYFGEGTLISHYRVVE